MGVRYSPIVAKVAPNIDTESNDTSCGEALFYSSVDKSFPGRIIVLRALNRKDLKAVPLRPPAM